MQRRKTTRLIRKSIIKYNILKVNINKGGTGLNRCIKIWEYGFDGRGTVGKKNHHRTGSEQKGFEIYK